MTVKVEEIEQELEKAIRATDDPKDRAMLMLIQKILLHVEKLLDDEESLRIKVFNGNYVNHTVDHDYIEDLRALDALKTIRWVNNRMNHAGYCDYAEKQMRKEKEVAENTKSRWNKFIESIIAEFPKAVLFAAVTLAGYGWLIK